jgi:hypothetical protein
MEALERQRLVRFVARISREAAYAYLHLVPNTPRDPHTYGACQIWADPRVCYTTRRSKTAPLSVIVGGVVPSRCNSC